MKKLLSNIKLELPESTYSKDPQTSDLGQRILSKSIELIDEKGFEDFTFKKLGALIQSNESSIYRYFKNKHQLLVYLSCWYWAWLEYRLVFETHNLPTPMKAMEKAMEVLTVPMAYEGAIFDTHRLHRIMINENGKAYLTKEVDDENKKGYFLTYKNLITRLGNLIASVQPKYKYSHNLASMLLESMLHQTFLLEHFPSITDANNEEDVRRFLTKIIKDTLK